MSTNIDLQDTSLPPRLFGETDPLKDSSHRFEIPLDAIREPIQMPTTFQHQKDISITSVLDQDNNKSYIMLTSVSNVDDQSGWKNRSYKSHSPTGPWTDNGQLIFEGESTPFMCAAGVVGHHAIIQTNCFGEGGTIESFQTKDWVNFDRRRTLLASSPGTFMAGIYDPEPTSILNEQGNEEYYMTFTAVEKYIDGKAKNGNIYLAKINSDWTQAEIIKKLISEKHDTEVSLVIPPHIPTLDGGEWVLEGGKAFQLTPPDNTSQRDEKGKKDISGNIIFYGTCFIEGEDENRQRGFITVADKIDGNYSFVGLLHPRNNVPGETGHGTVEISWDPNGDLQKAELHILHQARLKNPTGIEGKWQSERTTYNLLEFMNYADQLRQDPKLQNLIPLKKFAAD